MALAPKRDFDETVTFCVRKGILFPAAEIYSNHAGFFDYGPLGVELKRAVEQSWWNTFVSCEDNMVAIDSALISPPSVWEASGHLENFNDPLVQCRKCGSRFRADHLVEEVTGREARGMGFEELSKAVSSREISCLKCKGALAPVQMFNLMFKTSVGSTEDSAQPDGAKKAKGSEKSDAGLPPGTAYLRPETAQAIFYDFKRVTSTNRLKLPFGIAQAGRAFRNEISPRNFVFRAREFNQLEIEFFVHPQRLNDVDLPREFLSLSVPILVSDSKKERAGGKGAEKAEGGKAVAMTIEDCLRKKVMGTKWHAYWLAKYFKWLVSLGIKGEHLRLRKHSQDELSHYSAETWDIEYELGGKWFELMGIANRTDFDLSRHASRSGKDLSMVDHATSEKVVPFVIEPSIGVERLLFFVLADSLCEREGKFVLSLKSGLAPVKAAVFPLVSKDGVDKKAEAVFAELKKEFCSSRSPLKVVYDEDGSIGKRYARMDEAGCPCCITIDYDSLERNDATLRHRDTGEQERVPIRELPAKIRSILGA